MRKVMIRINGNALRAYLKNIHVTGLQASEAIGREKSYVNSCCCNNLINEKDLEAICSKFAARKDMFLLPEQPKQETLFPVQNKEEEYKPKHAPVNSINTRASDEWKNGFIAGWKAAKELGI